MSFGDWPDSNYASQAYSTWSASPYFNLAGQTAQQYGINQSVFQAIIGAESGYNPNATNGNAVGLGQLVVGSAPALSGIDAGNPQTNLNAAANFYSQLLSECGGDYVCASSKYGTLPSSCTTGNCGNLTQNQALVYGTEQNAMTNGVTCEPDPSGSGLCIFPQGTSQSQAQAYINKNPQQFQSQCKQFDFVCQAKTAIVSSGANILSMIAGFILLIVGIIMLRDRSNVTQATRTISGHVTNALKKGAEISALAA